MSQKPEHLDTVVLNIPISRQTLRDLLSTAIEGGSSYWADFSKAERAGDGDYLRVKVTEREKSSKERLRVNRFVTAEDLANGIQRLAACAVSGQFRDGTLFPAAGKHFADAIGDHDAVTADVVLQMTVFGELVYG